MSNERIPKEILKKVRRIEIKTRRVVNNIFSGEYHSVFKGRGMEFAEVREYQIGDDIRKIDWNVTARAGHPYIKIFDEERELTVMMMVDFSSSFDFGTQGNLKNDIATEICALLSLSAIKNNDRVGSLIFTDEIEKFIPPQKGKKHILRIIRELLYFKPHHQRTNLNVALEYMNKVLTRKCIIFLVSDFLDKNYNKALSVLSKRHDVIAITIIDPAEMELPSVGLIVFEDAETGEQIVLDSSMKAVRENIINKTNLISTDRSKFFKKIGVDEIIVYTNKSYIEPLMYFFKKRANRM